MKRFLTVKHFTWIERSDRQAVSGEITQVYLELSTHCNLSCRTCVRQSIEKFRQRHFTMQMMRRLLPMLKDLHRLERIVLLGFGEALCNPHFQDILKSLRTLETRIVLVSNAFFITEEMADFIVRLPLDEIYVSWDDDIEGIEKTIRRGSSTSRFRKNVERISHNKAMMKSDRPMLGLEIVATKSNYRHLVPIVRYGHAAGVEKFIVSNVFPYTDDMNDEILYTVQENPQVLFPKMLGRVIKKFDVRVARQTADTDRCCPFIEKGTVFITVNGDISPCPELAYSHPAYYFGSKRMHRSFIPGNISRNHIHEIWGSKGFAELRRCFLYFDFPDCTLCRDPDMCWHRTVDEMDCYGNLTPCGECLWAKDIVICP